MARYIDVDKIDFSVIKDPAIRIIVKRFILNKPTEDVVPKSEVEKLNNELMIWKQDRFNLYQRLELYKMAQEKGAREIFKEIDYFVTLYKEGYYSEKSLLENIAELKKKHTESEGAKAQTGAVQTNQENFSEEK